MIRRRNFRAAMPAFIRRESGLLAPDKSLLVPERAAFRGGYQVNRGALNVPVAVIAGGTYTNNNSGPFTTSTFSPGAGELLVAAINASALVSFPVVSGISGGGLSWSGSGSVTWNGNGTERCLSAIYIAPNPTAQSNISFTATFSTSPSQGCGIRVVRVQGIDLSTPTDTNANSGKTGSNASSSATTPNSTSYSTNTAKGITFAHFVSAETLGISAASGWTGMGQINGGSPAGTTSNLIYRINSTTFSGATLTWASGTSTWWGYTLRTYRGS